MGYLLIFFLVWLAVLLYAGLVDGEWEFGFILGILISIIAGGILTIIVSIITHATFDSEEYLPTETKIVALKDNVTSKGSFFLGSGSIEGDMTYFYMVQKERGMKIESISAESAYIVEEDRKDGVIEEYDFRFKNEIIEFWFPNWGIGDTVIKIPKGSIIQNYSVDLE